MNCKYHDIDHLEWSPERVPLQKLVSGENPHPGSAIFDRVLKTHAPASSLSLGTNDKLVYNVRDGRDVVNSYFHRIEKVWAVPRGWKRRAIYGASRAVPFRIRYSKLAQYFSRQWASQVQQHLDAGYPLIRYEDMLTDPIDTLKSAIGKLDPSAWNEPVARKAVDLFSLKQIRKASEESGAVVQTNRVGRRGDWENYFTKADERRFEVECGEVMRTLGYL
ncbi:MAG: sulfotransferase domain-containing protein [Pirellulales bacterium]|nr:sulfotransferase domain-containing protein [Pirellulales bacterium]